MRMRIRAWLFCALALLVVSLDATLSHSQEPSPAGSTRGTATIQYDAGTPDIPNGGSPGPLVGNLFNSQNGSPLNAGTVYAATVIFGSAPYANRLRFFGPLGGGTTAPYLGGVPTPPTGRFTFPPIAVPSSFLAGVSPNLASFLMMDTDSISGQGFHARYWDRNNPSGRATQVQLYPGVNAMIRVSGDIAVVPVELMEFDVE